MRNKETFEARAQVIKAMAHYTRLFIIEELEKKERCVGELTAMIGSDVSTVSKHLAVLRNAGIVNTRKQGNEVFYSLKMKCVMKFISCISEVLEITAKDQMKLVG